MSAMITLGEELEDLVLRTMLPPADFVLDDEEFRSTGDLVFDGPMIGAPGLRAGAVWTPEGGLGFVLGAAAGQVYPLEDVLQFADELMMAATSIRYTERCGAEDDEPAAHRVSLRARAAELRRKGRRHG